MDQSLFEQLLYEEESSSLDFKKEQYLFSKASDTLKSELLKDILGFANSYRRTEAYILIGVEEVRGGRSNVTGIQLDTHLDEHALQQFINNLVNTPIQFQYRAYEFEGKQVGVIKIEQQSRPFYLKKDYGKLKKNEVYVRRGSSTDPTKPALPEELVRMGNPLNEITADISVEFSSPEVDDNLGKQITINAELHNLPPKNQIEDYERPVERDNSILGFSMPRQDLFFGTNENYYRERAHYEFIHRLYKPIRLTVKNTGRIAAQNILVEITLQKNDHVLLMYADDLPVLPKSGHAIADIGRNFHIAPSLQSVGSISIEENKERYLIELESKNLQPDRRIWSDVFYLASLKSQKINFNVKIYASNLPKAKEENLIVTANIIEFDMTMQEIKNLSYDFKNTGD